MNSELHKAKTETLEKPQKLFMESNLLRICGALFCHDPKRASMQTDDIVVHEDLREKKIIIRPDPRHGQPGPLAHKVFLAILKKHSDYGRPIQNEISFGRRELIRLVGRKTIGGRDSDELINALQQIRYTHVLAFFKAAQNYVEHDFNIFSEIMIERRISHTDPIVACTLRLGEPIIASLREDHFVCFNHSFMQSLSTISQAIYMRLFFHFSNLYETQQGRKGLRFQKRYDDICREWLGGLAIRDRISHIKRDQLGRHLDQLVAGTFLSTYQIEPAKSRAGFIISFRPGPGFFADYEQFYRHRRQGELQWQFQTDQRDVAEPLKLAYLFLEKRIGKAISGVPYVSSSEVQHAKAILAKVMFADAPAFLDFAFTRAQATRYDPQSIAGITKYLEPFLAARERSRTARKVQEVMDAQEAAQTAYNAFCRDAVRKLLDRLPEEEVSAIESLARRDAERFSANPMMIEAAKLRIAMSRHAGKVPAFDEWRKLQAL